MNARRTIAAGLCALALAGCAGVQFAGPANPPPASEPTAQAQADAEYCATVTRAEHAMTRAIQRAYSARDAERHSALQLALLDFLADNPGGCYRQWWADQKRDEAAALRVALLRQG